MKHKHMFSLLDQTFTTCRVAFAGGQTVAPGYETEYERERKRGLKQPDQDLPGRPWGQQTFVYKVPKAWELQAGDAAIVLARGELKIVYVVSVDIAPDIDVDADFDYKWLVQKIDTSAHDALVEQEKRFHDVMLEVERVKQRESLVNSFRDSLPEGSAARALFEQTTIGLAAPVAPAPNWAPPTDPDAPVQPAPWAPGKTEE